MKRRKTIMLIMGTNVGFFRSDSLEGVSRQAKELGYDVIVLSAFTLNDERTKHQFGEENIYTLIKSKHIDGYIVVEYTLWTEKSREIVLGFLKEMNATNVVMLDDSDRFGYKGVICDDRKCFEQMTDHLIDYHGFRKLFCLTGFQQYDVSVIRLNGFFDSLKKHGIEVTDDCWSYGDFWTQAATELADKIATGKIERPEAVICGNDKSAVTLTNELILRGIEVPDDIAVVGFDFGEESVYNSPTITTCKRPTLYTGEMCVCVIHNRLTGENAQPIDGSAIEFVSGESCGCHKNKEFSRSFYEKKNALDSEEDLYRASYMQENLMACEGYEEFIDNIFTKIYLLRGIEQYALCLNKSWNSFKEDDNDYLREGYDTEMCEALYYDRNIVTEKNVPFDTEYIIPENMLREEPTVYFVNTIHFEDRCFGYEVSTFTPECPAPGDVYHSWSTSLSVSLEYMRMQERMKLMYDRVFASSVRDAMTGLYNRKGYELYSGTAFGTAKEKKLPLLVGVADLDGLKRINDIYGHTEGDNAITVLAQAISACCGNGEFCIRSGGDEFYIIGCYDYKPEITDYYHRRINGYLSRYNEGSGKPYLVEVSVGFFLGVPEGDNIEEYLKIADSRMYEEKAARKKARSK